MADCIMGRSAGALTHKSEVDHHDRVFLDDADQHQHPDDGDHAEVEAEDAQRQQRADHRRRQAGQDGQRMDEAFVENAQNDVDRQDRGKEQQPLSGGGILEYLGRPGEAGRYRGGQRKLLLDHRNLVGGVTQRHAGRQVERDGYSRKLAQLVDRQQAGYALDRGERRQRYQFAGGSRTDLQRAQQIRGPRNIRIVFDDDLVTIAGLIDGRRLVGAEALVERIAQLVAGYAEQRRLVGIDDQ